MRTDRELLEMAAKAYADPNISQDSENFIRLIGRDENFGCDVMVQWNPLTNDGDALRLAVKLSIDMSFNFENAVFVYADEVMETLDRNGNDLCAATRRAIVRAAAEIGRQMQEGGAA